MNYHDPTLTRNWDNLKKHHKKIKDSKLKDFFKDQNRFNDLSWSANGLTVDLSKNFINLDTLGILYDFAKEIDLESFRSNFFSGEKINNTEDRPALFHALRDRSSRAYFVDEEDISLKIKKALDKIIHFSNNLHSNTFLGLTGKPIKQIVNIGIGGSKLGPQAMLTALEDFKNDNVKVDFISEINTQTINNLLNNCDPEATIFFICSKSFTTKETIYISRIVKSWIKSNLGKNSLRKHLFAVTSNSSEAIKFGVDEENIFPIWDWVNGRFSLWSSIGISIALGCSSKVFEEILYGAFLMDRHFENKPLQENLPVVMGLADFWNVSFLNYDSFVILPYEYKLRNIPDHLQQLVMESNGKGVLKTGESVKTGTSPLVFGSSGIESQHSFMQLLHQSPKSVHSEIILSMDPTDMAQDHIVASALAQSSILMSGSGAYIVPSAEKDKSSLSHQYCRGNRSNSIILLDKLSPTIVGSLFALFELRTCVQGFLWGINSFDQWGVELGKNLMANLLDNSESTYHNNCIDSSTISIWKKYLKNKANNNEN